MDSMDGAADPQNRIVLREITGVFKEMRCMAIYAFVFVK